MSRYQRMEVGAGRPMELKIYPTTRTGKILTIKQDNFDSVTVPSRTESLLAKRERENEKEGKKKKEVMTLLEISEPLEHLFSGFPIRIDSLVWNWSQIINPSVLMARINLS